MGAVLLLFRQQNSTHSRLLTQVIFTYQENFVISTFRNKKIDFVYSLCGPQVIQFQFIAKVA
jgi:hypothetical protein